MPGSEMTKVFSSTARRDDNNLVVSIATDSGFVVVRMTPAVAASHIAHIAQAMGSIATQNVRVPPKRQKRAPVQASEVCI